MRFWRRPTIACQQWVELVTDYLEGSLPARLQQAADNHLADCDHCREYLEQLRRTVATARNLLDEDRPVDLVNALARAFADYHASPGST